MKVNDMIKHLEKLQKNGLGKCEISDLNEESVSLKFNFDIKNNKNKNKNKKANMIKPIVGFHD